MIVERLHVDGTVNIEVTATVDGVAERSTVFEFRTSHPRIVRGERSIAVEPVEDWQFVQRQLIGSRYLLLVVERRTEVTDALLHRVLPSLITIRIKVLVDRRARLLDLGMGGTLEVEVQVLREVPAQGEVSVPEEL